jgi:hypothetical protein
MSELPERSSVPMQDGVVKRETPASATRAILLVLILLHIGICCLSLVNVADYQSYIPYQRQHLGEAIALVAPFSLVALLFVFCRFSFGYFAGFFLYTMMLGFLWLSRFTQFHYDTTLAAASAAASTILFLLPALLIRKPFGQIVILSRQNFERLLMALLTLAAITIAVASAYNFRLTSLAHIYDFRGEAQFPFIVRYLVGIVPNAILPFVFASCLALRSYWKAALALLLMPLFYPITVSKLAFFAPVWLLALTLLSRLIETRMTVVLSLLVPTLLGIILISTLPHDTAYNYFNFVNIRMMASPPSSIDFYNDFFSSHPNTYFCQITILKRLIACPYQEQLGVVMESTYHIGNLNASLFATEGIASVGLVLAPLAALACGLVIAVGNRASSGLPARFVLISGSAMPPLLLNVPLTVALVTYGAGFLVLLWYITPRSIFDRAPATTSSSP